MKSTITINRLPPSFTPSLSLSLLVSLLPSSSYPPTPSSQIPPPSSHVFPSPHPPPTSSHPLPPSPHPLPHSSSPPPSLLFPSSSFLRLLLPTTPSSSSFLKKFSNLPPSSLSPPPPRLYSNAFEYWEQEFKGFEEIQVAIGRKDLLFSWEEVGGAYQMIFQLPPNSEEVLKSYAGFVKVEGGWEEGAEIKVEVVGEGGKRREEKGGRKEEEGGKKKEEEVEGRKEEGGRKEEEEDRRKEEEKRKEEEEKRRRETEKWLRRLIGAFKLRVEIKSLKGILRAYKRFKGKLDRWRINSWQFGLLGMINGGDINIDLEPRQIEKEEEGKEEERGRREKEGGRKEEEEGRREEEGWEKEVINNLIEALKIDEKNELEVELMKMVKEMGWTELELDLKGVFRLEAKMKRD